MGVHDYGCSSESTYIFNSRVQPPGSDILLAKPKVHAGNSIRSQSSEHAMFVQKVRRKFVTRCYARERAEVLNPPTTGASFVLREGV